MIRRRSRTHRALVVAWAALAAAGPARAGVMATYQLVNTSPSTTGPVSQVVASIVPAGSVAPPSPNVSPLTILPGSAGFNAANLTDYLGDGTLSNGSPLQVLRLQFDSQGLSSGGTLNFGLNLGPNYTGPPPTLLLPPGTTGLSLLPYTSPVTPAPGSGSGSTGSTGGTPSGSGSGSGSGSTSPVSSGSGSGGSTNLVPEPISLALWSVAAGLGLLRARMFRRARQALI